MYLDDKLSRNNEKELKKLRDRRLYADGDDEESTEEWFMYAEREKQPYFNKDRGVFEETDKKALNSALSVFDATAVFRTKQEDNNGGVR